MKEAFLGKITILDPFEAEVQALLQGLRLCYPMVVHRIIIEWDYLYIVDTLKNAAQVY